MKTNKQLVEFAKEHARKNTPYFYGAKMVVVTKAVYDMLKNLYPGKIPAEDVKKIGLMCCDCSGLISAFTGVARSSGEHKAAAKRVNPITTIADAPIGALVWHEGHIGIYVGMENGKPYYIAEECSAKGCVKLPLSDNHFTHWFLSADVDYGGDAPSIHPAATNAISVGNTVAITPGSTYGGLGEAKGKPVPATVSARLHTVALISVPRGEALLKEINSWVSLAFLTKK